MSRKKLALFIGLIAALAVIAGGIVYAQETGSMALIDSKSPTGGLVVRPLSAHHFPPSIPEQEGWLDREKLFAARRWPIGRARPRRSAAARLCSRCKNSRSLRGAAVPGG